jgi:polar amino acid transport system substrate-binding protein
MGFVEFVDFLFMPLPPRLSRLFSILPLCAAAQAWAADLVMLAPIDQAMPIVRFQDGHLTGGIVKDLGDAIAKRMGRRPVYLSVDVPGLPQALTAGRADAVCYVLPFWIDGDYLWSSPLIPDSEMVVARPAAPVIRSLKDLLDQPVGTVGGYRYPRVEQVLGKRFFRVDADTLEKNLQQLQSGKVDYTIIGENTLAYQERINPGQKFRVDVVFSTYKAQCALSRKASVGAKEFNHAIDTLLKDGSVSQILARYR